MDCEFYNNLLYYSKVNLRGIKMSSDLSPEILALLQGTETDFSLEDLDGMPSGDLNINSETSSTQSALPNLPYESVNLLVKNFQPIEKCFADTPVTDVFDDKDFYKKALSNEAEKAQRLHAILSKYLQCDDPRDRTVYRQQITTVYWDFAGSLALKMSSRDVLLAKKMLLRFGVVLPSLFTPQSKEMFSKVFLQNTSNEPVYYLDEWFRDIGMGRIQLSATDEAPRSKKPAAGSSEEQNRLLQLQSKSNAKIETIENYLIVKEGERSMLESELKSRVEIIFDHPSIPGMGKHRQGFSETQKKMISDINEKLRQLLKVDKELSQYIESYKDEKEINDNLRVKVSSSQSGGQPQITVSASEINTEIQTVHQMAKMTVGRQGNQFPLFTKEFFHCPPNDTGCRENVIKIMDWIEKIDPTAYCRTHKRAVNRIIPFVILIPSYGDKGICWEPYTKYNKVTSRGRIAIPMYPKNLKNAVLTATADLRWQVAKEKASYYWMEEGITGQYYQWFVAQKLKGDIKDYFIKDYLLWMIKESEGIQALEKDVRGIFWRHMPFAQDVKDKLKTRSLVYQELYQRDINKSMSDGY